MKSPILFLGNLFFMWFNIFTALVNYHMDRLFLSSLCATAALIYLILSLRIALRQA